MVLYPDRTGGFALFTCEYGDYGYLNDMFYSAPEYGPEAMMCVNNCDFLINNGRLHCLYIQSAGDRKFPVAMSGTYDLAPYLASATIAGWGPVTGGYRGLPGGFRQKNRTVSGLSSTGLRH